mmetsp:Transcript_27138/g.56507  ORF Transcript_27138/g.56507 Transcript_27138/m.56507 type:complete len:160 (-) Transcript_27138:1158-1637(-)
MCANMPFSTESNLLCYVGIYIDDFCLIVQGDAIIRNTTRRHLFHIIDQVFCPNDSADSMRQEPNSLKKLRHGDACWTTRKKCWGGDSIQSICRSPSLLRGPTNSKLRLTNSPDTNGTPWQKSGTVSWASSEASWTSSQATSASSVTCRVPSLSTEVISH